MKKILMLCLSMCLWGCSVTETEVSKQPENSTIDSSQEVKNTTSYTGSVVDVALNGFQMVCDETVLFVSGPKVELKVGDEVEVVIQGVQSTLEREIELSEGDEVRVIKQAMVQLTTEDIAPDSCELIYQIKNANSFPIYVAQPKFYSVRTGLPLAHELVDEQRMKVSDELEVTMDLSTMHDLERGDYIMLVDYYKDLDSDEVIGQGASMLHVEETCIKHTMFKITSINSAYFTAEPLFDPSLKEKAVEYRIPVQLEGVMNEALGEEFKAEDLMLLTFDIRLMTCSDQVCEIPIISYEAQAGLGAAAKPVIYLYPEKTMDFSVTLDYDGELTTTYPQYRDGWHGLAKPDGTLIVDGHEYSYLFWEGIDANHYDLSKGFVVKGEDSAEFLQTTLSKMGLLPKEYNEFIVYWAPLLAENKYNLITFQQESYTDHARLTIEPKPDSMLRVFMVSQPLSEPIEVEAMEIEPFERHGFTVVEWGGYQLKK